METEVSLGDLFKKLDQIQARSNRTFPNRRSKQAGLPRYEQRGKPNS
jgi:hypothetical protein